MTDTSASIPDPDQGPGHRTVEIPRAGFELDDGAATGREAAPTAQPRPLATPIGELNVQIEPRFEWSSAPASSDPVMSVLLTLTADGAPLLDRADGPVAHLVLALDVSASMDHADKYPVLVQALEGMLADLQTSGGRDVLISVVAFADGAETLFRGVLASELTASELVDAVDRSALRFGRYTDLVGALSRAGRIAYDSHREHPQLPVRVYVMTDGKPQDIVGAAAMMRRIARMPIDIDALAFGSDADVGVMQQLLGGHRGGTVKHVRKQTLGEAYERIGAVARRVVSKRALVSIALGSGVVGGAVYRFRPGRFAYGAQAFRGGTRFEADLGTLESGRRYSLLFQVRLPQTTVAQSEIGMVILRVPGFGGPRSFRCALAIPRHRGMKTPSSDPFVVEARQVLEGMENDADPAAALRALGVRRKLYVAERRDPFLVNVVDKAIAELRERGTLDALSTTERASLVAHTATAGSLGKLGKIARAAATKREYTFG